MYYNRQQDELERLNREHGVIESVNELSGWHLVGAQLSKPGVYRIQISRERRICGMAYWEFKHGFASQHIITTARELGLLSAPNGYTLP